MKINLLILFILFFSFQTFAQNKDNEYATDNEVAEFKGLKEEKKKIDLSRFRVGGDFGLGFGNNTFFAEISPLFGYQIIRDRLEIGPGLIYQHISAPKIYAENNYGGQAYLRGYIWSGFFAQVDGFLVSYNGKYIPSQTVQKFTYGNGFVGVGYAFNHTEAPFYINISVKTNIIKDNVYTQRLIIPKIGFQFRL
jgi:hypothetical protein